MEKVVMNVSHTDIGYCCNCDLLFQHRRADRPDTFRFS